MKRERSIHEFDFGLICEYFSGLERQGPGSPEATLKALGFVGTFNDESRIADIGCGTGAQTMVLARNVPGRITGVDLFPGFIDRFNADARKLNVQERVRGIVGNMEELPFGDEELDLIWSEGAIYNIGFERGMNEWRRFLKPGGHMAVTEISWLTDERPGEIERFWREAYPEIDTIPNKIARMQETGYALVAVFVLPESCWTEHFYVPQVAVQEAFLKKHAGNKVAEDFIAGQRHERDLYDRYKAYYGYVFYIGEKG